MAYEIKSEFIKSKIRGRKFSNEHWRGYVKNLVAIERIILEGAHGSAGVAKMLYLQDYYEDSYNKIFKELKPKEFEKYLKEKQEEEEELKRYAKEDELEEKGELELFKKQWLSLGGKE